MISVNSENLNGLEGKTVSEMLKERGFKTVFVAVECNGKIIPKKDYDTAILHDGDKLEVVSFVGGG